MENNEDYLPKGDKEFYLWLENFLEIAQENKDALNISQEDLDKLEMHTINFYLSMRKAEIAEESYRQSLLDVEEARARYTNLLQQGPLKDQTEKE